MNSFFSRNNIWIFIALIVLIIFIFWLKANHPLSLNEEEQPIQNLKNEVIQTSEEKDQKVMIKALTTGEDKNCETISDSMLKNKCLQNLNYIVASQENTQAACQDIEDAQFQKICLDKVSFKEALEKQQISFCEKISDENFKKNCLDQVNQILVQNIKTPEGCLKLSSETLQSNCLDDFSMKQAVQAQNPPLCDKLSDKTLQAQCRQTIENNKLVIQAGQEAMNKKFNKL